MILGCKTTLDHYRFPPASAVFLISRVGNSETAEQFLQDLSDDPEIGQMVYSSKKDLLMKKDVFRSIDDNVLYTGLVRILAIVATAVLTREHQLVQLFLAALQAAVTSEVP